MQVAVIGAGIVGMHCALALLERGKDVVLYDRVGPAAGASKGNAGVMATYAVLPEAHPGLLRQVPSMLLDPQGALSIRWSHLPALMPWLKDFIVAGRPENMARSARALEAILGRVEVDSAPVFASVGADTLQRDTGVLHIYRSESAMRKALPFWRDAESRGVPIRLLDAAGVRDAEPALSGRYVAGILLPAVKHTVNPEQVVRKLFAAFLQKGGRFEPAVVTHIEEGNAGARLHLDGERSVIRDEVVIACGAHSAALCNGLGYRPPLDTERGYNTTLPQPSVKLNRPVCVAEAGYYMTPMAMGLRIGGKVELGGLHAPPRWSRSRSMVRHASKVLPGLNVAGGIPWMGFRPSLPDSLPVIGAIPGCRHCHVAFGHGHLGLTLAAPTARMLADLMSGQEPPIDPTPFSPMRFI